MKTIFKVWSQINNDFVEDGIVHIDAWESSNEDEQGKVIAKINIKTHAVTYLDERAKTDKNAQEAIQEALIEYTSLGLQ